MKITANHLTTNHLLLAAAIIIPLVLFVSKIIGNG